MYISMVLYFLKLVLKRFKEMDGAWTLMEMKERQEHFCQTRNITALKCNVGPTQIVPALYLILTTQLVCYILQMGAHLIVQIRLGSTIQVSSKQPVGVVVKLCCKTLLVFAKPGVDSTILCFSP